MEIGSIWPALIAAAPVIIVAAQGFWKKYKEWKTIFGPKQESWDQREAERRDSLDRRSEAYLDRLERDVIRLEREGDELRADRDYGWDLARYWCGEAHRIRHDLVTCRFASGITEPVPQLPGMEEPLPRPRAQSQG